MIFKELPLKGAFVVEQEPRGDERGSFARAFCQQELSAVGIDFPIVQANNSTSAFAGTVRGIHLQVPPHAEQKFVRCIRGAIADVLVDLRPESPTFGQHHVVEISAEDHRAVYVPERFGHLMQSLVDDTEVLYFVSAYYSPGSERGLRHDDPDLKIALPAPITEVSEKDRQWAPLAEQMADLTTALSARNGEPESEE